MFNIHELTMTGFPQIYPSSDIAKTTLRFGGRICFLLQMGMPDQLGLMKGDNP
jgi:hypothetical protein